MSCGPTTSSASASSCSTYATWTCRRARRRCTWRRASGTPSCACPRMRACPPTSRSARATRRCSTAPATASTSTSSRRPRARAPPRGCTWRATSASARSRWCAAMTRCRAAARGTPRSTRAGRPAREARRRPRLDRRRARRGRARRRAAAGPDRSGRAAVRLRAARDPRVRRRDPARRGPGRSEKMSAVPAGGRTNQPLRRDIDDGIVAGVCSGIAKRYGTDPIILRVVLGAATLAGGTGLIVYLLAWALVPEQGGRSPSWARLAGRRETWLILTGSTLLLLSMLLLLREWGLWFSDAIVWPVLLAGGGAALIWRQSAASAPPAEPQPAAPVRARPDRPADPQRALRLPTPAVGPAAIGAGLVVAAALVFLWLNDALAPARDVILAVLVVVIALTLILAPWWLRLVRGLTAERAERIRSQERSEVAAPLPDSALKTLALGKKRPDA